MTILQKTQIYDIKMHFFFFLRNPLVVENNSFVEIKLTDFKQIDQHIKTSK